MLITFDRIKLQSCGTKKFEILNVSAFQICLYLFCDIILSKVINNFLDIGKNFECGFEGFEIKKHFNNFCLNQDRH